VKIIAYTSPARGHLYPIVPILLELRERGHDVAVWTLADEVDRLRSMGISAEAISSDIEKLQHNDFGTSSPQAALKRSVAVFAQRAALEIPEVELILESEAPDRMLVDANTWGAAAAAERWGGSWASFLPYPAPLPSADVPPFGPGLKPRNGPLGRLRNRILRPLLLGALERTLLPSLNEARRSLGLSAVRDAHDMLTRPPLTLYFTSREFEYPRSDWPDSWCMVGPLNWEPESIPPKWVSDLTRPVVLVTTSSEFQDDSSIVQAALAGLADEPFEVVATMPAGVSAIDVPANGRVEQFIPHSPVLAHTEVAITHGGMGATQKALSNGVPVVVIPFGRDQHEVGRRAEHAGVGVYLPRRQLSPGALRDAVREARKLRPAARQFAQRMASEGGAPLAADRLEQLGASPETSFDPRSVDRYPAVQLRTG
jgi:MGT family glycosyltransferase